MTTPLAETELLTERLILRPYQIGDAADVELACNDPLTRRWIPLPDPYDAAVARDWVTDQSHRLAAAGTGVNFAVLTRDGGRLIGGFGLHGIDDRDRQGEIGYWVAPWARGQGYAAESVRRIAQYAFDELRLGRIEVRVQPANAASHRVAAKAGCTYEGLHTSASTFGDGRIDLAVWRLLPGDPYPARRALPDAAEQSDGIVSIRPARLEDAPGRYAERADIEYQRWLPAGAHPPPTLAGARQWLEGAAWRWVSGQAAGFAVVDVASGEYAGSVEIYLDRPAWATATVGYSTHPAFRQRRFLRRALPLVAQWAFADAGLGRLEAGVAVDNIASARTAESAGFTLEGTLRRSQPVAAGRTDMLLYSLLPADLT